MIVVMQQNIKLKKITWYSAASLRSMIPAAGFPAMIEVGDLAFTAMRQNQNC